jgi:hypothetical protein
VERLTSPEGSVSLAITALLLVLGFRLARPRRLLEWLAVVAFAGALVVQHLAARGLLPARSLDAGLALRLAGTALLVAGLVLAGTSTRARVRAAMAAARGSPSGQPGQPGARAPERVYPGLALVAIGQLLRGPSTAGALAVGVAVVLCGVAALSGRAPR